MSRKRKKKNKPTSVWFKLFFVVHVIVMFAPVFGFSFTKCFGILFVLWMLLMLWAMKIVSVGIGTGMRSYWWPCVSGKLLYVSRSKSIWNYTTELPTYDWAPVVRYSYRVNGVDYESGEIRCFAEGFDSKRECAAFMKEIGLTRDMVGASINVYYDPAKPSSAVLFRGVEKTDFYGVFICGAVAIVMLLLAVFLLSREPLAH